MKEKSAGKNRTRARLDAGFRGLLLIYACLAAIPLRYHAIGAGLDASWAFALNFAHHRGLIFGRQAGFTYGPLAYLILPMPIGHNLAEGILFQLAAWLAFSAVLAWLWFSRKPPIASLLLFTAGVILGADSFRAFGYAGVDTFLVFLALLLLASSLVARRWYLFYGAALALSALLFFIKFSSAISAMSAAAIFAAGMFLVDRRKAWYAVAGLGGWAVAVFGIGLFVLEPSPAALWHYVRLGLDISSGYSVAMSLFGPPGLVVTALWILLAWVVALGILYWRKAASWPIALACLGPLFLEFKHSFVREAGHEGIVFLFVPLLWAIVALFTDFHRKNAWYTAAALALPALFWYPMGGLWIARLWHPAATLQETAKLTEVLRYPDLRRRLEAESARELAADRLPPALLARVGERSIAPFPTECSYAAANPLDGRLFPLFQMYQSYTPFLDGVNAAFLEDARRAPTFVLLDWTAIDERHPLLDVPSTALAMYRHYEFDSLYGEHMLLRRRATPLSTVWRTREKRELGLDQPLRVPAGDSPMRARIYLRWNLTGQLLKFFFRVPEVRLIASSAAGRVLSARIPPEVMEDGVPLNFLPFDFDEARALFDGAPLTNRIEALAIGGPGGHYLEPVAHVEIEEAPGIHLSFADSSAPDFSRLQHLGQLDSWRIEMLNDTGATGFSQVTVPDPRGYVLVRGWAVVNDEAAGGIWLEVDGKRLPARYGMPRRDIAALFHRTDDLACGFEATIPAWEIGQTWHELSIRILTRDHSGYYDGGRTLRFKIE